MSELHELVATMRELGVVRLRKDSTGILEIELAPPAESANPIPPSDADDDVGPVDIEQAMADGMCVRCGKVKASGLVPGHCRPCGKMTVHGN